MFRFSFFKKKTKKSQTFCTKLWGSAKCEKLGQKLCPKRKEEEEEGEEEEEEEEGGGGEEEEEEGEEEEGGGGEEEEVTRWFLIWDHQWQVHKSEPPCYVIW